MATFTHQFAYTYANPGFEVTITQTTSGRNSTFSVTSVRFKPSWYNTYLFGTISLGGQVILDATNTKAIGSTYFPAVETWQNVSIATATSSPLTKTHSANGSLAAMTLSVSFNVSNNSGSSNYGSVSGTATITPASIAKQTYTISYNANGGTGAPAAQTKTYGTTLTLSSTKPTRTGYAFSKWNTKANGSGTSYNAGASYTANAAATLYAQWTANTYSVTYDANGGTGAPSAQTKTYGTALTLSSTKPTKAQSTANGYKITFNANGGTASKTNATATDTTTYTFKNWNTKADGSGTSYSAGATYTDNAALTLYAQYTSSTSKGTVTAATMTTNKADTAAAERTVTFDATTNGGMSSISSRSSTATISYTPKGWYTATSGGSLVANMGATFTPSSTSTVYAQWNSTTSAYSKVTLPSATKENTTTTRTVKFDVNGGSSTHSNMVSSATTTYSLSGWWTSASGGTNRGEANATYTPSASEKLYAQFTSSTGSYSAITLPIPTRVGYKFLGWAESADASSGLTGSYTPTKDITLYAIWESKEVIKKGAIYKTKIKTSSGLKNFYAYVYKNGKWIRRLVYIFKQEG